MACHDCKDSTGGEWACSRCQGVFFDEAGGVASRPHGLPAQPEVVTAAALGPLPTVAHAIGKRICDCTTPTDREALVAMLERAGVDYAEHENWIGVASRMRDGGERFVRIHTDKSGALTGVEG